jgi:hypothetical protein
MTTHLPTNEQNQLEYFDCFWGEYIRGTKEQLQSLGIGIGNAFPGEPGGPKRCLRVLDPRGFVTRIEKWYNNGYRAGINYHGRGTEGLYDLPEELRELIIKRLWALPRPAKLTARSGVYAQHRLSYAADADFQTFRAKLLNPVPLEENDGAAS